MRKILIKGGRVFDGNSFFLADVLVTGSRVEKIAESIDCTPDFCFDASGCIVCAGLVDIHTHLEGVSDEAFGIQAEMATYPFGVTAANEVSAGMGGKALIDSHSLKTTAFVTCEIKDNKADTEKTQKLLELFGNRVIGVKAFFDTSSGQLRDAAPLKEICGFARKKGLKVMVHTSNSPISMMEIAKILSSGDIITHAFHGGVNNSSLDGYECLEFAKQKGITVDAGLAGFVHTDFAVLGGAIKSGVLPDTIGSDITKASAYMRGGRYGLNMCMSIARELGMSEEDILRAVTVNAAAALGKQDEWGELKVGKNADIAVLKYTDESYCMTDKCGNTVSSDRGYRCMLTIVNGVVVYRDR